ncbi:MAG: gluconeogenesis factor YvcK family protein [Chloroflexota bacterium]|nr:gluconeogenesis factor YvcK family protein [Chloroflexota bacterium]
MNQTPPLIKWFTPGIGVKRWILLLLVGVLCEAVATTFGAAQFFASSSLTESALARWLMIGLLVFAGAIIMGLAMVGFARNLLAPYRAHRPAPVIDVVYSHSRRNKGVKVVAIGGGTGLPAVLKGLKAFTSNITALVTVADDGGSSGRLRRDLGVLPPGDLRNNIAALADDESLMTRLFQYRFDGGELGGHAFGNLFITALAGVTGSLETALCEIERVLNIQGSVLPATLDDVKLVASVRLGDHPRPVTIYGESQISAAGGIIDKVWLTPAGAKAFRGSVEAIRHADMVIIGPGSLYTSIVPNLLIDGIAAALRETDAIKIYICNIATQPGETRDYTVADHVMALERTIGRGVIQIVLANDAYPKANAGSHTHYVQPSPIGHEIAQRYDMRYVDLVDTDRPWRHDSAKLVRAILSLSEESRTNRDFFRSPPSLARQESYHAG